MASVWEAVNGMGYESSAEADVIVAAPTEKGHMYHARLEEVATRDLEDVGTLYVASGRFRVGTVGHYRGRVQSNLYDIIDLPFDFDLKSYVHKDEEAIWAQPYEETEREIEALAADVLEAMSAIRLSPFTISSTGYGVLARVRVASPFRRRIEDLRNLQAHYIQSINRFYGAGFCDKQVGDAGTRLTRVVGSYNEKADTPRPVRLLHQGDELFDPTGIPIIRRPQRTEEIPEPTTLAKDVKEKLTDALAEFWSDGYRHQYALGAAGLMAKSGVTERDAVDIVREAAYDDPELDDRERAVHTTYDSVRSGRPVAGFSLLVGADGSGTAATDLFINLLADHARATERRFIAQRPRNHAPRDENGHLRAGDDHADPPSRREVERVAGDAPPQETHSVKEIPRSCVTGWWQDYLRLVAPTTSSPDIYHLAAILTVAGTMVGRRIGGYLGENQWPILHTVLVGETGLTKKDTAMNRALATMMHSERGSFHNMFTVLSGVGSAEALADQLGTSNVLLRLSEFSGFLHKARQPATANLRPMITELWNCGPEYSLITRGNPIRIQNPTMSLLAAIPPETLTREMTGEDIQSGFANRLLFVYGTGKQAIARPPQPNWEELGLLASEMRELIASYAPGTVLPFSQQAGDYYDEWFYDFVRRSYLTELERQMAQRVPAYVVRVALLYAIADGADEIGLSHAEAGREYVLHVFDQSAPHTRGWGANDEARLGAAILSLVTTGEHEGVARSTIDRTFSEVYGSSIVGRTLDALRNNGRIDIDPIGVVRIA